MVKLFFIKLKANFYLLLIHSLLLFSIIPIKKAMPLSSSYINGELNGLITPFIFIFELLTIITILYLNKKHKFWHSHFAILLYLVTHLTLLFHVKQSESIWSLLLISKWNLYFAIARSLYYESPIQLSKRFLVFFISLISLIGILQFLFTSDLHLRVLQEPHLDIAKHHIAPIVSRETQFLRSYSIYTHPNVFSFMLLISQILIIHHIRQSKEKKQILLLILLTTIIANILTFSYTGYLINIIIAFIFFRERSDANINTIIQENTTIVLRETKNSFLVFMNQMQQRCINIFKNIVSHETKLILLIFAIAFTANLIYFDFSKKYSYFRQENATETSRSQQNSNAIKIIRANLNGVGIGNYMFHVKQYVNPEEYWNIQPVHNTFLLLLAEIGIINVFLVFLAIFYVFFRKKLHNINKYQTAILIITALFALSDHFLLTYQPTMIIIILSLYIVKKE